MIDIEALVYKFGFITKMAISQSVFVCSLVQARALDSLQQVLSSHYSQCYNYFGMLIFLNLRLSMYSTCMYTF